MRFDYHCDFVEQAVFLTARRDAALECELHEAIDRLYRISDAETRQRALQGAYSDKFKAWNLGRPIADAVREFDLIVRGVGRCVVATAARRKDEIVELFSKEPHPPADAALRTLLIQLRPESLLEPTSVHNWLQCELYHVSDMLDERFGYVPDEAACRPEERALRRDRYSVLWRVYIAGRRLRTGEINGDEIPRLRAAFCRVFPNSEAETDEQFTRLLGGTHWTHQQLQAIAANPPSPLPNVVAAAKRG